MSSEVKIKRANYMKARVDEIIFITYTDFSVLRYFYFIENVRQQFMLVNLKMIKFQYII